MSRHNKKQPAPPAVADPTQVSPAAAAAAQVLRPAPQGKPLATRGAMLAVQYSGPIPPPEALRAYEDVSSGLATRIVEMAEKQAGHRQACEMRVLKHEARRSWGGLITGFAIAVLGMGASVYVIISGNPVSGTVLGTADLAYLVAIFVYGKHAETKAVEKAQGEGADKAP